MSSDESNLLQGREVESSCRKETFDISFERQPCNFRTMDPCFSRFISSRTHGIVNIWAGLVVLLCCHLSLGLWKISFLFRSHLTLLFRGGHRVVVRARYLNMILVQGDMNFSRPTRTGFVCLRSYIYLSLLHLSSFYLAVSFLNMIPCFLYLL